MNYLPSRNITVIMHFTVLLALKNNVTVELITKSVIILNLAVWSYRPLSIFSYANDDSDSKCVFSHKKQKVTTHLFWKATTLHTTKSCRNYLGKNRHMTTDDLTLNLPTTTIVAKPFNIIKWQLKFNPVA